MPDFLSPDGRNAYAFPLPILLAPRYLVAAPFSPLAGLVTIIGIWA